VSFTVKNIGSGNTANLVGTLLETNGVTPRATRKLTALSRRAVVWGPSRSPSRLAEPVANHHSDFATQDGVVDLGTITYTFLLGQLNPLAENF